MPAPSVSDYLTDVAYPAHFHRETMPVWLAATLTALGRRSPDLTRPYTWLELGCGSGLNLLLAATANPCGQFVGIDFNKQAIEQARTIATSAGLSNVSFHCETLQQTALRIDRDDCDFIVTHGVYSWVNEANRSTIDHIIGQRLRPGGVAYIAYMCHPGAVSFAAAQQLMRLNTQQSTGSSAQRARVGMTLLQRLAQGGAGYFVEHPAAAREMQRVADLDDAYLAHELLNDEWHSLHVADVMARLKAEACDYVGSATPIENMDAVSVPSGILPIIAELQRQGADQAQLETLRDIARNQNQRRDLYQKRGTSPVITHLSPDEHRHALLNQRVIRLPAAPANTTAQGELVLDTRIGPVRVPMALLHPILHALNNGARSYVELARLPAYAGNPGQVNQLLQILAWAGWLHFQPLTVADNAEVKESVLRLQSALAQAGYAGWEILPAIGSAYRSTD